MKSVALFLLGSTLVAAVSAPLTITLPPPAALEPAAFAMGTSRNPAGSTLAVDSRSLLLDGQAWTPVMGEFHYARYPAAEWRDELLKMRAGGIDIVATYVFWIHHEEIEGEWDWSGARDLRSFIATVQDVGLKAIVRCGPWCHGEVRNGGLPDWIVARGKVRSDDPAYLSSATSLYRQVAAQLRGLLWKDGGPVIGIQLENEYRGPAQHLLTLKRIAREAGLDVPLYTRTGWPALATPMPFGEILPLFGVYAEGFWDRELTAMPGNYWAGFHFSTLRTDANIANEALGRRDAKDDPDVARHPYLTCEIGGGMMSSYHRRIDVDPRDIESTTLVKLGSGSNSPGYYMYHGGTNPEGRLTTLMEEQAAPMTNWNDLPVKNYDFQAPLGQYGQVRPQYHLLRRLHLFLRDCGSDLAGMPVALPDARPAGRDDVDTLRWSVRSDGQRGFVFVNNHERGRELPPKRDVQFTVTSPTGDTLTFPTLPITVPAHAAFVWPFRLDLGGVTLVHATAQPVTHVVADDGTRTLFFAATPGIPAEFAFDAANVTIGAALGHRETHDGRIVFRDVPAGRGIAIDLRAPTGRRVQIVLLSDADSLALWKGAWQGRPRVFLSRETLIFDGDGVRVVSAPDAARDRTEAAVGSVSVFPVPERTRRCPKPDGLFARFDFPELSAKVQSATFELLRPAGPLRKIGSGKSPQPVAAAPTDADFTHAAVWRIKLPANLDLSSDPLLRLHYTGDVARAWIAGRFVVDDFYNGDALELGLRRHAAALQNGELTIAILPLQKTAPILFPAESLPEADGVAALRQAGIVFRPALEL